MIASLVGFLTMLQAPDTKTVDLKDGFIRVEGPAYSFEIPKGWTVGKVTPWGARDLTPAKGGGQLGAMTAGPTQASWDQLFKTSMYFISRETSGKPTTPKIEKGKNGMETCVFSIVETDGLVSHRYVMLKSAEGKVLALSVKIPEKESAKTLEPIFDRFVKSAKMK